MENFKDDFIEGITLINPKEKKIELKKKKKKKQNNIIKNL